LDLTFKVDDNPSSLLTYSFDLEVTDECNEVVTIHSTEFDDVAYVLNEDSFIIPIDGWSYSTPSKIDCGYSFTYTSTYS